MVSEAIKQEVPTLPKVALIVEFYEKFRVRDMSLVELMNDAFEFNGQKHPIMPHEEILQTKMAFLNWSKVYNTHFEHIDITPTHFEAEGEGIVATLSVTYRDKSTDKVATIPTLHHWTFKDGIAAGLRVTGV